MPVMGDLSKKNRISDKISVKLISFNISSEFILFSYTIIIIIYYF